MVATTGSQIYNGPITLLANVNTTLQADNDITFDGNISSAAGTSMAGLIVQAGRSITIGPAVAYVAPSGVFEATANWSGANASGQRGVGAGSITEAALTTTSISTVFGQGGQRDLELTVDGAGLNAGTSMSARSLPPGDGLGNTNGRPGET